MDLPSEKHSASPITGRNPQSGSPGQGSHRDGVPDEDADLDINDEVFRRPSLTVSPGALPPKQAPPETYIEPEPEPSPAAREPEARKRRKNPLEKRHAAPLQEFKRVLRPQTAYNARAAADRAKAESPATLESVDSPEFVKARGTSVSPDLRRNKLHGVLDSAYRHSGAGWLDVLDRLNLRFFVYTGLSLLLIAWAVFKYFGGFGGEPVKVQAEAEAERKGLPSAERTARGRAAVEALLAARTIPARLPLVMDPERAAPRMKEFYENLHGQDPKIVSWEVGAPVGSPNGDWLPFIFTDAAGRKVTVPLGETEKGCIVDWENFTAFGDMLWADFCQSRPVIPKSLRVRLRRVEKYETAFPATAWQSYEVEHRSGGPRIIAYASRTGRYAQTLAELVKGEAWQCALLYIRWSDPGPQGFPVIEDIVRTRWQDEATSWTGP